MNYCSDKISFDTIIKNNKPVMIEVLRDTAGRSCIIEYKYLNLSIDTEMKLYLHNDCQDVFGLPRDSDFEYYVYPSCSFELLTKEQLRKSKKINLCISRLFFLK